PLPPNATAQLSSRAARLSVNVSKNRYGRPVCCRYVRPELLRCPFPVRHGDASYLEPGYRNALDTTRLPRPLPAEGTHSANHRPWRQFGPTDSAYGVRQLSLVEAGEGAHR